MYIQSTCVDTGGNYRIGVLEGTVTGTYEARFIGAGARENYRRQKIEELEELLLKIQTEEAGYQQELEAIKEKNRKLETDKKSKLIQFTSGESIFDKEYADCPAQYAN